MRIIKKNLRVSDPRNVKIAKLSVKKKTVKKIKASEPEEELQEEGYTIHDDVTASTKKKRKR